VLTTCLFNIFLPINDWELKPNREYKGKGLLEQIVRGADDLSFEINVNGTKYYMHYDDWLKQRRWLKEHRGW
jgi:hypothetical protein